MRWRLAALVVLALTGIAAFAAAEAAPGAGREGEPGTVVAVLDTGVSPSVRELVGRVLPGTDLVDRDGDPDDDNNHGTAVAATVASTCPGCRILPVRVLSAAGVAPWARIAEGIVWAVDHGARVINVSIAGIGGSSELRDAIAYALRSDVLVVAAAGNAGDSEARYPAAYDGVVGVAATGSDGRLADWSSRGAWVDFALPGCAPLPMVLGTYAWACGTSFAAPLAAGAAGRERGDDPTASAAAIAERLPSTLRLPPAGREEAVRVTGLPRPGSTLQATAPTFQTSRDLGQSIRWFRCAPGAGAHECTAVSEGARYRVRPADVGWTLVARVVTEPFGGLWVASSARLSVS